MHCADQRQLQGNNTARNVPEAEALGAALLRAGILGVSGLLANWEPTALSKKPPPATKGSVDQ